MGVRRGAALAAACFTLVALGEPPGAAAAADLHSCSNESLQPSPVTTGDSVAATLCLINAQRAHYGRAPLRWNWRLWSAAQRMAADMVARQFFSHDEPGGKGLLARVTPTGYLPAGDDWSLGENLAWGDGALGTPVAIVSGWMTSPGHRANVLAADYREVGIACLLGSPLPGRTGGVVYVAEFGHAGGSRKGANLQRAE